MESHTQEVKRTPEEAGALLASLVGQWEGTNRTWFQPGELADTSPIRAAIRLLPGSSFLTYEYQSSMEGNAFQGMALIGYNVFKEHFELAWGDAFHQSGHLFTAAGPGLERGFSVVGQYTYDAQQPALNWRIKFEPHDADHLIVSMYNNYPPGSEYLGVETQYQRV